MIPLVAKGLHFEYVQNAVVMGGAGGLSIDTMTGSFNNVNNLVVLASTFSGAVNLRNIIPNGTSEYAVRNNKTGVHVPAANGILAQFAYP